MVPHGHGPAAPFGQADDVGGFLGVGREGLFDKDVATGLKRVHRQPIMRAVGGEDGYRLGRDPGEHLVVIGKHGGRRTWNGAAQGMRRGGVKIGQPDDFDIPARHEPPQVDMRDPATSGDPDPQHGDLPIIDATRRPPKRSRRFRRDPARSSHQVARARVKGRERDPAA